MFNAIGILALGAVIGYLYDKLDGAELGFDRQTGYVFLEG